MSRHMRYPPSRVAAYAFEVAARILWEVYDAALRCREQNVRMRDDV